MTRPKSYERVCAKTVLSAPGKQMTRTIITLLLHVSASPVVTKQLLNNYRHFPEIRPVQGHLGTARRVPVQKLDRLRTSLVHKYLLVRLLPQSRERRLKRNRSSLVTYSYINNSKRGMMGFLLRRVIFALL